MKIGIIGTGNMGKALATLLGNKGHDVLIGSRDPAKGAELAKGIRSRVRGGSNEDAAEFGEIAIVATPFGDETKRLLASMKSLASKIVIDITNPLTPDYMNLTVGHTTSAAEQIAAVLPGAKVVKAFNHTFAQVLQGGPEYRGGTPVVLFCGDDAAAKKTVADLIGSLGFQAVDVGPLMAARFLEPTGEVMIRLGYAQGRGTNIALALLDR